MVDKPGVTTLEQLAAVERAVAETGRIWSVCSGRLPRPRCRRRGICAVGRTGAAWCRPSGSARTG